MLDARGGLARDDRVAAVGADDDPRLDRAPVGEAHASDATVGPQESNDLGALGEVHGGRALSTLDQDPVEHFAPDQRQ